jgi:hypothetical protein
LLIVVGRRLVKGETEMHQYRHRTGFAWVLAGALSLSALPAGAQTPAPTPTPTQTPADNTKVNERDRPKGPSPLISRRKTPAIEI